MMITVPLTAVHAEAGLLDATLPDLGGALAWEQVHRVRPPAPLTCRACSAPMAAKVSVRGMRFFAHRADASDCPTVGETIAHRLLKLELAAAIRDAGWHAELEVPGHGWRADVLAVSPDGTRRIAFEAQLAAATVADLAERTHTMAADGVEVCWITDKDTTWVTHVPSARVRRPGPVGEAADETASARTPAQPLIVVDGHARFEPNWCTDRAKCVRVQNYGQQAVPCPGHGSWYSADAVALSTFVRGVCGGHVRCISTTRPALMRASRHDGGTRVWTTQRHHRAEADQRVASEAYEKWATAQRASYERQLERAEVEQARHHAYIEALLTRQAALIRPTVEFVYHAAGVSPRVLDAERLPRFAMGVPVLVGEKLWALICPVATRITPALAGWFATATIVVADDRERERIARYTRPGQRFKVIDPGPLLPQQPRQRPGIGIHQAVSRMFGGFG
jgi:competence protein CoiA